MAPMWAEYVGFCAGSMEGHKGNAEAAANWNEMMCRNLKSLHVMGVQNALADFVKAEGL